MTAMADGVDEIKPIHFEEKPVETPVERVAVTKKTSNLGMKFLLTLMIVVAGIGSGYLLSVILPAQASKNEIASAPESSDEVKVGAVYGDQDKSKFKDEAEGVLVRGGVDGEGSHHIMRAGGKSQNVYLTSSVLDLSLFENHKVEVDGETFESQKAGWLMDVGRLQVIELNAEKPFEEESTTGLPEE